MAVPKNKVSKSKTNSRFANWKLKTLKKSHQVCPKCGYYDGEQVVQKNND